MTSQTKYMMAGSIIAGVGTVYGIQKAIDSEYLIEKIEENKALFLEIIDELVKLSIEFLEKILKFIKKLIKQIIFKTKMLINA